MTQFLAVMTVLYQFRGYIASFIGALLICQTVYQVTQGDFLNVFQFYLGVVVAVILCELPAPVGDTP